MEHMVWYCVVFNHIRRDTAWYGDHDGREKVHTCTGGLLDAAEKHLAAVARCDSEESKLSVSFDLM